MRRRTKKNVRRPPRDAQDFEETFAEDLIEEIPAPETVLPILGASPLVPHPCRRKERRFPIASALVFSALFHLSMVSLFSIVIFFPRHDITYYDFRIVRADSFAGLPPTSDGRLRAPRLNDPLSEDLAFEDAGLSGPALPDIELPTLEFAELGRLRVRQEGLRTASLYDNLYDDAPRDAWEQFGHGLRRVTRSLKDLTAPGTEPKKELALGMAEAPVGFHPAEGFGGTVEWKGEPRERRLLFTPPIEALWNAERDTTRRPIELVLEVNAHGRVVNVWSPAIDETGLVDRIQMAVLRYRFEPLGVDGQDKQLATLRIFAEGGTP